MSTTPYTKSQEKPRMGVPFRKIVVAGIKVVNRPVGEAVDVVVKVAKKKLF